MFRALTVASTPEVSEGLAQALTSSGQFGPIRSADVTSVVRKLDHVLRISVPDVVFLEASGTLDIELIGRRIGELYPGMPVVAYGRAASWEFLLQLMRAGVCEYLATPIYEREVAELAQRLDRQIRMRPAMPDSVAPLISFLPAKAGVGASTIAINTSAALAQQFHTRTLLMDLDFSAGIMSFALDVKPVFSVLDALDHVQALDHELWAKIVVEVGNLHVLPAPDTPGAAWADLSAFVDIVHFGRRMYDVLCVDLSGAMEDFTLGVMEESKHVFVVASLETPVLHLARRRIARLSQLGFRDRLSVIVNRWSPGGGISLDQVTEMLGRPVYATVCNDYSESQKAFNKGVTVNPSSTLGRDFASLAALIGGHTVPAVASETGILGKLTKWFWPAKAEKPAAPAVVAVENAAVGVPAEPVRVEEPAAEPAPEAKPERAVAKPVGHRRRTADPLEAVEIDLLLARCEEESDRAGAGATAQMRGLILLLWESGVGLEEALQLTPERLQDECHVGEGGWPALSGRVVDTLEQCPLSEARHFFGENHSKHRQTWRRRLNDFGKRAGVSSLAARLTRPRPGASNEVPDEPAEGSLANLAHAVMTDAATEAAAVPAREAVDG